MTFEEADAFIAKLDMADVRLVERACKQRIAEQEQVWDLTEGERAMLQNNDLMGAVKSVRWRLNLTLVDARTFVEQRR